MTIAINTETNVRDIPIVDVQIRFRLRTPKEEKVRELAESIKTLGLLNPITIDNQNFLVCGYHRLSAYKLLGFETIPAITKDYSLVYSELGEIDENLKVSSLSKIEIAEHIVRREELYSELGMRLERGISSKEGFISTDQLASESGISNRAYRLKRQPARIVEDVRDQLRDTKFAEVLMDMVKLSQQTPEIQRSICKLLISGKRTTFKKALVDAQILDYRKNKDYKFDFNLKERWGRIPNSIMRFSKANSKIQKLCDVIHHDEDIQWLKREGINFGGSKIPVYQMAAEHAEFLITYYTPENGIVLDSFMGRATIGTAALVHGRKFVGFDITKKFVDKTRNVFDTEFNKDDFQLINNDSILLEEFKDHKDHFDAVCFDPPYVKAERYSDNEKDLSNMTSEEYMLKMREHFKQLYRLIKKSDYKQKKFFPVICKVGTVRDASKGIFDMDSEFQSAAKEAGFVLWDKVFNELYNLWGGVGYERNYENKYVQKSHETNLVFCKF